MVRVRCFQRIFADNNPVPDTGQVLFQEAFFSLPPILPDCGLTLLSLSLYTQMNDV